MNEIKLNCSIDKDDYMTVDYTMGQLGIDIFNGDEETNVGIVLTKEQTKELIDFLKKFVL